MYISEVSLATGYQQCVLEHGHAGNFLYWESSSLVLTDLTVRVVAFVVVDCTPCVCQTTSVILKILQHIVDKLFSYSVSFNNSNYLTLCDRNMYTVTSNRILLAIQCTSFSDKATINPGPEHCPWSWRSLVV